MPERPASWRAERSKAAHVSRLPMSPMCWLMKASWPEARQNAFFSSPPTASVGAAAKGSRTGRGAYPRERRSGTSRPVAGSSSRTESSHGTWMGRSWWSQPSAMAPSRSRASSSSKQMGSSVRLPLVMTSTAGAHPPPGASARARAPGPSGTGVKSRWCSGV